MKILIMTIMTIMTIFLTACGSHMRWPTPDVVPEPSIYTPGYLPNSN